MAEWRLLKTMTCCTALLLGVQPSSGRSGEAGVEHRGAETRGGADSDAAGPAVERLVRAAAVYDEQGMRDGVDRLARIGAGCLPYVRPLFRHADPNVRWQSVITVGRIAVADRSCFSPLLAAARDEDADVRGEAVSVLAQLFPESPPVLAVIAALERDVHPVVRAQAFAADWGLRKSRPAVEALIRLLGDRDWMAVQTASRSLVRVGSPAIPGLLQVLDDADVRRRSVAVRILGQLSDVSPVVVQRLGELARSDQRPLAAAAMDALAQSDRRGWLILAELAESSRGEVRAQALCSACRLPTRQPELLPVLNSALHDGDARVRLAAMATIRRLRIGDEQAVQRLCQLLQDRLPDQRAAAVAALGGLDELPRLARTQLRIIGRDDPVDYIRRHAQRILDASHRKSNADD